MSAYAYQRLLRRKERERKDRALSYINNRSRGIWNFLTNRSDSMTYSRMLQEVHSSIPTETEVEK